MLPVHFERHWYEEWLETLKNLSDVAALVGLEKQSLKKRFLTALSVNAAMHKRCDCNLNQKQRSLRTVKEQIMSSSTVLLRILPPWAAGGSKMWPFFDVQLSTGHSLAHRSHGCWLCAKPGDSLQSRTSGGMCRLPPITSSREGSGAGSSGLLRSTRGEELYVRVNMCPGWVWLLLDGVRSKQTLELKSTTGFYVAEGWMLFPPH